MGEGGKGIWRVRRREGVREGGREGGSGTEEVREGITN